MIRNTLVWIDIINEWVGRVVSFLLIPLALIIFIEVVARFIFGSPTIWVWDVAMQIFAPLVMLAGGYVLLHKAHVAVDVFVTGLSPKRRAIIDLTTAAFLFFGCVVLIWEGWTIFWESLKIRETLPTVLAPPYYTVKMMIPIGAFLLLLQGVAKFVRDIIILVSKEGG